MPDSRKPRDLPLQTQSFRRRKTTGFQHQQKGQQALIPREFFKLPRMPREIHFGLSQGHIARHCLKGLLVLVPSPLLAPLPLSNGQFHPHFPKSSGPRCEPENTSAIFAVTCCTRSGCVSEEEAELIALISLTKVRDGICVDPPLCRGSSQGKYGSCSKSLVCVGEIVGEMSERELVLVVSVRYGKR